MNWRLLLIASLGLNLLLAAFVVKRASTRTSPASEATVSAVMPPAGPEIRTVTREVVVTNVLPAVELEWPRWSDWASEDWGEYRTNLLAAGCPGVTVREILHASLRFAQFAEQQSVRASVNGIFWDALARHGLDGEAGPVKQAVEELDAIEQRYDELSNTVLKGLPGSHEIEKARRTQRNREQQFDHLEPDKRQQAAEMVGRHELRRDALVTANQRPGSEGGGLTPEGSTAYYALEAEHTQQLEALLGPEGTAEWRLRINGHADWASNLRGLEVTPEEMRQIGGWKGSLPTDNLGQSPMNAGRKEAEQAMNDNIRELLGEERFATMQEANQMNGGAYVALFDIAERFELPSSVIQQSMEMQQSAHTMAEQIRANNSLTAAQRRDALRAIQQETRQAVEGLLGADAFHTYQRHGGEWINGLSTPNAWR